MVYKFWRWVFRLFFMVYCLQEGGCSVISQGREVVQDFYSRFTTREVDLVFVLDRSASVPTSGWQSMLDFVRTLLEHFTLNRDNTRIAVISFSTHVSVDIDDLEEGRENKCSMMKKLHLRLGAKVMTGYTATNEALSRARTILLKSRSSAKKAVFVLTDGKSNIGQAPVQASIELRSLQWDTGWNVTERGPQLEIYGFGIKDAYMPEVRSVASPLPNHTYFIPDFRTFEELARSLHDDEQQESWEFVSNVMLCENKCSANGFCTCATRSGQYLCVCQAGYYGNGFTCTACPHGSYKNTLTPHLCRRCPGNSTTLLPGATSSDNCVCRPPYHQNQQEKSCELLSCPELPEIPHAHKFNVIGRIKDEVTDTQAPCINTPETSCHYKCIVGYRLNTHPGLICNMNGTWSGQVPQCKVVDCKSLEYHGQQILHGVTNYLNRSTVYQAMVQVECLTGWRLLGDAVRHCSTHGIWSGTPALCVEARCPALRKPVGGKTEPSECATARQMPGAQCVITCGRGYIQRGPQRRTCMVTGSWNTDEETACVDTEAPTITCPSDIRTPVTVANYAIVHWDTERPTYTDNSGTENLHLQVIGVRASPVQLSVGYHQVKYIIRDASGNEAFCTQGIHVVDRIIRMEFCPSNIKVKDVQGSGQQVTWPDPVFRDNNNISVPALCSIPSGSLFPIGTRNVRCAPREQVENNADCTFSVTLERIQCHHPREPLHGSLTCSQTSAATICSVHCNNRYDFYERPQLMYTCVNGHWQLRQNNTWWPDCSRQYIPRRARMRSVANYFYYGGACERKKAQIAQKFTEWVQRQSWDICGAARCPLSDVEVSCGVSSRRRRAVRRRQSRTLEKPAVNSFMKSLGKKMTYLAGKKFRTRDKEQRNVGENHITFSTSHSPIDKDKTQKGDIFSILEIIEGGTGEAFPSLNKVHDSKKTRPKRALDPENRFSKGGRQNFFPVQFEKRNSDSGIQMHPTVAVWSEEERPVTHPVIIEEHIEQQESVFEEPSAQTPTGDPAAHVPEELETTTYGYDDLQVEERSVTPQESSGKTAAPSTASSQESFPWTTTPVPDPDLTSSSAIPGVPEDSMREESDLPELITVPGQLDTNPESSDPFSSAKSPLRPERDTTLNATEVETSTVQAEGSSLESNASSSEQVHVHFTVSLSSNVSEMTLFEQQEVVQLLYDVIDGIELRLNDTIISLDNDTSVLMSAGRLVTEEPEFDPCQIGQVEVSELGMGSTFCVLCPVGTYSINSTCRKCPAGQYQDQEGQLSCLDCPANTTTDTEGAIYSSFCRVPCNPGYFSSSGLDPCIPCPKGSFQDHQGSTLCSDCPLGTSTADHGSSSLGECHRLCNRGRHGVGGVEPCELCPLGSYQPLEGRAECLMCPEEKLTDNLGATSEDMCQDDDICVGNMTLPCQNNGTCITADQNGTVCQCPSGWTGQWCELDIQECDSNPCFNGGTCIDGVLSYVCQCAEGFGGSYCELDVDACLSSPCNNGGSCVDLDTDNGYNCYCDGSYTGQNCEIFDDCSYYDCHHGEIFNDDGVCQCQCDMGFVGVHCEFLIDLCLTFPCVNSVKCHTFDTDFECDCLPGYTGKTCSEEIDECDNVLCRNGGICYDRLNGFYCSCPGGYVGEHCEEEVHPDFDLVYFQKSSANFIEIPREIIPIMQAVTVCFWTRTSQMFGSGTVFSYAIPSSEDSGTVVPELGLSSHDQIRLIVRQEEISTGMVLAPYVWHHLCLTWQSEGGVWAVYVNGTQRVTGVGVGDGAEMVGGGTLILGQMQNSEGHIFNIWESFVGEITQFNIYDEILPLARIRTLANQDECDKSYGNVMAWTQVLDSAFGNIIVRNLSHCMDVNECMWIDNFPCPANHLCDDTIGGFNCSTCQYGYEGSACTDPTNECFLEICENEATCTDGPEPWDFVCHCRHGYTGQYCEVLINYCWSQPCFNNGTCVLNIGGYACECPAAEMGPRCEDLGTACWPNPCQNGGVCSPQGHSFRCSCPEGFNGTRCENTTHHCHSNPCHNGGLCQIQYGRHICYCDLEWKGETCDVKVSADCSLQPCLNGGTCENVESSLGYLCHCETGSGVMYDVNCDFLSPCVSSPCFDRGICVSLPNNTFMCDCHRGFSGQQCQIDDSLIPQTVSSSTIELPTTTSGSCSNLTCHNGGSCVVDSSSALCECPLEFTGHNCEVQKHKVTTHYKGQITLLVPYTDHNRELVKADFGIQMEKVMEKLKTSGTVVVNLQDLRSSADKSEMLVSFKMEYSQYVTRLGETIRFTDVRRVLHAAVSSGHIGSFQTSIRGFQLSKEANQGEKKSDHMTLYLSIGLVCTIVLLICVSAWVMCKIRRHRKEQQRQNLLPGMNNAANINLAMLSNPVFEHTDETYRRTRGSFTEENPYAEFGETILPYEVTYSTKANVKDCNLARAAARKNSEVSFTSAQSAVSKKDPEVSAQAGSQRDYITPVLTKNELSKTDNIAKDDKKLLPNLGNSGHTNPAFDANDYLLPVQSAAGQRSTSSECQGHEDEDGYLEPAKVLSEKIVDEKLEQGKGQTNEDSDPVKTGGQGSNDVKSQCPGDKNDYLGPVMVGCQKQSYVNIDENQGHSDFTDQDKLSPIQKHSYVNVGQEQDHVKEKGNKDKNVSSDNLQYIDMQKAAELTTIDKQPEDVKPPLMQRPHSPIDRRAYMINKPGNVKTIQESANDERPPDYLEVFPPKVSDLPRPDISKRKLPPIPKEKI